MIGVGFWTKLQHPHRRLHPDPATRLPRPSPRVPEARKPDAPAAPGSRLPEVSKPDAPAAPEPRFPRCRPAAAPQAPHATGPQPAPQPAPKPVIEAASATPPPPRPRRAPCRIKKAPTSPAVAGVALSSQSAPASLPSLRNPGKAVTSLKVTRSASALSLGNCRCTRTTARMRKSTGCSAPGYLDAIMQVASPLSSSSVE